MRAAIVGGAAYAGGRASARNADREAEQEQRLQELEGAQYGQPAPVPAAAAPAPTDRVAQLTQLKELLDSGVLSQQEFEAEKARILQGG